MKLSDFIYSEMCLEREVCESIIKLYNDNKEYSYKAGVSSKNMIDIKIRNNSFLHIGKHF